MSNIERLSKELRELKRYQKFMKKIAIEGENHLHSGELAVVDFIYCYSLENSESPTLVQISKSLLITQATVTVLVNRLIEKELVIKVTCENNKSQKLVSLTEKGVRQLTNRRNSDKIRLEKLSEFIGDKDTETLTEIVSKINAYYKTNLDSKSD